MSVFENSEISDFSQMECLVNSPANSLSLVFTFLIHVLGFFISFLECNSKRQSMWTDIQKQSEVRGQTLDERAKVSDSPVIEMINWLRSFRK